MSVEPPPRVDGESDAAYDLFVRWLREIGPDQLGANKAAAAQLGISPSKFATLKSRHKWVARRELAAWDANVIDEPEPDLARVIDLRSGAGVALVGDVVDKGDVPPAAETHREVQVRRATAAEAAEWRDNLASGVHSLAALGPKAAAIVTRYFDSVLTGDSSGDLAFAAGLIMRHMLPPTIAHQVMTELSSNAVEDRARALGLTHPERGRQSFADLADRIAAAGAIEDPRAR